MDALSEILRSARLSGGVFLRGEFTEPWCMASTVSPSDLGPCLGPTDHLILYHFVLGGRLNVTFDDEAPQAFAPGQAAVFPHNDSHRLSGREPADAVPAGDLSRVPMPGDPMIIEHGGGGAPTRIVCGFLGSKAIGGDPLFSSLPKLIRYDSREAPSGRLVRTSLDFAEKEWANGRPGADAVLARLSELLFVEAVRSFIDSAADELPGLAAALKDRCISRAIALMHRHPDDHWTVDKLGRAVGASRSTLAEKFARHLGIAPVEYLTQHRMRLAARELATTGAPIQAIAAAVGYGSEAAFSRAFKRSYRVSPSAWRRDAAAASRGAGHRPQ